MAMRTMGISNPEPDNAALPESPKQACSYLELSDLIIIADEQIEALKARFTVCLRLASCFQHLVDGHFLSRPDLLADDNGSKKEAINSDAERIESAIDAIVNSVQNSTSWIYLYKALQYYRDAESQEQRLALLQEVANVCRYEYYRKQSWLLRHYSTTSEGEKFYRKVYANGSARVKLKKGVVIPKDDSLSSHILRLCQSNTQVEEAAELVAKIDALEDTHADTEQYKWNENVMAALDDLSTIVRFTSGIRRALPIPSAQVKNAGGFIKVAKKVDERLCNTRLKLNRSQISVPTMYEEQGFRQTLRVLGKFFVKELDQDLVKWHLTKFGRCLAKVCQPENEIHVHTITEGPEASLILKHCRAHVTRNVTRQDAKPGHLPLEPTTSKHPAQQTSTKPAPEEYVPFTQFPCDASESMAWRGKQKRYKAKTRPTTQFFSYEDTSPQNDENPPNTQEQRKVDAATAAVFHQLFDKSETHGALAWDKFSKALTSKGVDFTMEPSRGSAFTFIPPAHEANQARVTFHKPHGSQGHKIPRYTQHHMAHRLSNRYDWNVQTFTVE
ncbi:hypothetical protein GGR57DRAFT_508756 [Xylariaceae sp. FL1272]|nr:hypothetical protein GGR57DRAFT_508756 [Xylariaceae sp. FL1272]